MESALDALEGIKLVQLSLSTSKVLPKEHRAPFALRLHHAWRLLIQAHDVVVVTPDTSSLPPALALNVELAP